MLAEFLLTPDAFAEDDGRNGTDVVRELGECLFPRWGVPVALVSKLGDGEWLRSAGRSIVRIRNPNHRQLAMSLFQQLTQVCVTRPMIPLASDDEAGWITAGVTSASHVPLNGIVVSSNSTPPAPIGVSVKDFVCKEFWEEFENPRRVGRELASQAHVLRAICTHADWLIVRLPQIRGGSDDEIVTVKQILKLSNGLPAGFSDTRIDLHVCNQRKIPPARLTQGITDQRDGFIRRGAQVTLTIWPEKHFIDRELLAGEYTRTSTDERVCRPLWWITMTHVAVGGGNARDAGEGANSWNLFSRQRAHERYEEIISETPLDSLSLA